VRSARAARALTLAGHLDVRNLDGGLFAWANERRALVADGTATVSVHPFDARWGRLLRRELRAPLRRGA
jgi:3-mercaptopyruvate sulfurtransferase SseA